MSGRTIILQSNSGRDFVFKYQIVFNSALLTLLVEDYPD